MPFDFSSKKLDKCLNAKKKFKIEYLILKGLGLKSSKSDPK